MLMRSFVGFAGLLGLAAVLLAQDKPAAPAPPAKPGDAAATKPAAAVNPLNAFKGNRLSADEVVEKDARDYQKLARGVDDPPFTADRRKELLDRVPRYLIYRLTWDDLHEGREKYSTRDLMEGTPGGTMDGIYKMFPPISLYRPAEDADEQAKRDKQKKYLVEFRAAAMPFLREVLKNRLLVARLNAAIALERFAEYGQEEVADEMTAILEDPNEHDAVKHWAIKGLGGVFASVGSKPRDPKRLERTALAVYKWLDEHTKTPPQLLAGLSEPEQDAIRYIRKEAIRTLGEYRRPLIVEDAKANRREGPTAELLVLIMNDAKNKVAPEPNWSEREEAAAALCRMQSKLSPTYQPEFVASQIGRFIAALGAEASRDPARNKQRWQYYAAHLKAGTDTLAIDLGKGNPAATYFGKLMDRVNPVLENLYDERKFQNAVSDLNESLNSLPPKGNEVFGGGPMEKK